MLDDPTEVYCAARLWQAMQMPWQTRTHGAKPRITIVATSLNYVSNIFEQRR
jgi:hypothetical protein